MTLRELVSVMNIADVAIASLKIHELYPCNDRKLNMFDLDNDPILARYGDREVIKLTNVAGTGDTIWIK